MSVPAYIISVFLFLFIMAILSGRHRDGGWGGHRPGGMFGG